MKSNFQMIVPKSIDRKAQTAAIDAALIFIGFEVMSDMENATHGWESETKWDVKGPRTYHGDREWVYETDSVPFLYVNDGTEGPYPIPKQPRPIGQPLHFLTDYAPRTTPGAPFSGGPGQSMGPWRSAHQVMHPGIEARNFTGQSAEKRNKELADKVQQLLNNEGSL